MTSKTEKPTAERLRRAAREGDVPYSSVLVRTAALFAAAAIAPSAARAAKARFVERLHTALDGSRVESLSGVLRDIATLVVPVVSVAAAVAAVAGLAQTKGAIGFGRRAHAGFAPFDRRRAARAALGALVVFGIGYACVDALRTSAPSLADTVASATRALRITQPLLRRFAWSVASLLLVASVVDFAVEHLAWLSRLRMSPQEVKEERREREGDPELRRARRRAHEALVRDASPREP